MPAAVAHPLAEPLIEWYRTSARDLPWRRPEFHAQFGAWGVLVSEFMLQQTPVTRVIPRLAQWLDRWPTPAATASATPAEIVQQWANLGYPRRALWLHGAAIAITEQHGGVVPADVPALLALPGIGDYTARAVAVFAYGRREPVVDTNTRRVLARHRAGQAQPDSPSARDLANMAAELPQHVADSVVVNAATMELGATICVARAPQCDQCPVRQSCLWFARGRPDTGDRRRKQARYEGSDRQARGAVLQLLRGAHPDGCILTEILPDWPDAAQRDRAIDSLIADGLAEAHGQRLSLPD